MCEMEHREQQLTRIEPSINSIVSDAIERECWKQTEENYCIKFDE